MPSIRNGTQRQEPRALPPFLITAPYIAPPPPPYAHRIPPMPPPDVLDPDLEDEDLDLPLEEDPDTGSAEPDEPEEGPGTPPQVEDIRRRRNGTEDPDTWPSGPEKQRKPDVDGPVPEPEKSSHRPHSRLH